MSAQREEHIKELEGTISTQQKLNLDLRKDLKVLGKRPISDSLESISIDKIQSAERLSFLFPVNDGQSLWVQFRKKKQCLQCAKCGGRSRSNSRCMCLGSVEKHGTPSIPKIYYQWSNNSNVGDMEKKLATLLKKSSIKMYLRQPVKESSNYIPPDAFPPQNSDSMEIKFTSSSTDSKASKGEIIQSVLAPESKNEKKVVLKRCRIESFTMTQNRKHSNVKIKIRGHRCAKPVEVFSSLLFSVDNRKRLKQMSLNCGSPKSTNLSNTEVSALYSAG